MNIFEQYGIKEVADVCLYSIELDENDDEIYVPVLYLDTLKVSTIEETAEQTSARGGLGNPELIIWDYGKDITVNLEDALYTPASQSMTWSGKYGTKHFTLRGKLVHLIDDKPVFATPISIIIQDFKNFTYTPYSESSNFLTDCYRWTTRARIVSDDNQYNFIRKEDFLLYYDKRGKRWTTSVDTLGSSNSKILWGDVNQDGVVDMIDILRLNLYLLNKKENPITPEGEIAADVTHDEKVDADDSLLLMNYILMTIDADELGRPDDEGEWAIALDANNPEPPQDAIYQIDHALQNVHFLDRMEKCVATQTFCIDTVANTCHGNYRYLQQYSQCELTVFIDPRTMQPYEPNTNTFTRKNGENITGELRIIKKDEFYYKWTRSKAIDSTSLGHQIIVDAIHFPGTYRLVGETYARSRKTGKDQRYQFEIPLCKMGSENNLTLQADGEPTTFNMSLKVLRREDGVMMKLTQFDVAPAKYDGYMSDSTVIVPGDEIVSEYSAEIE